MTARGLGAGSRAGSGTPPWTVSPPRTSGERSDTECRGPRGENADPRRSELRLRFRRLRSRTREGGWRDALPECARIYELLLDLEGRTAHVLGWVGLIHAVAHLECGSGERFRSGLANLLRHVRREKRGSLRATALACARAYRVARALGGDALEPASAAREEAGRVRVARGWPSILAESTLGAFGRSGGDGGRGHREGAGATVRAPASVPDGETGPEDSASVLLRAALRWSAEAGTLGPEERARAQRRLAHGCGLVHGLFARAVLAHALAEIALADLPNREARSTGALERVRADFALAAGLFQRLGLRARARRCEDRWALLGPVGIENGRESDDAGGAATLRSLEDVRRRCAAAGFVTRDEPTLREAARLLLLAPTPLPVLIQGESGTGKEVLARAVHRWSQLGGEFVAIHCGAIPRELLESELFGHARGAFTGAAGEKPGLVEIADGGTLFLDEIGEMSAEAQMKMLRVLESGEVRRVGDLRTRKVQVRIVAATHRDLGALVQSGDFRLDLLHRIGSVVVRVPPLRARRADIALLVRDLLATVHDGLAMDGEALAAVVAGEWPGNVRELRAAILRAGYLARALGRNRITADLLGCAPGPAQRREGPVDTGALAREEESEGLLSGVDPEREGLDGVLESLERRLILRALDENEWNRTRAARSLGGLSRTTLISKMKRLGIDAPRDEPDATLAPAG